MLLISFVAEMFTNMLMNFYENRTTGHWNIGDLASPIYMVHPVVYNPEGGGYNEAEGGITLEKRNNS